MTDRQMRLMSVPDSQRSPYTTHGRSEVRKLVPRDARRILDVGCNDGAFGAALLTAGPEGREVWGIEPSPADAEVASEVLTGAVVGTFPESLDRVPGHFDCIAFNHVLEHMVDPWNALRVAASVLTPDGVIVGELPNVRFLPFLFDLGFRGRFEYTETGLLDRTHLRFFTRSSMHQLFDEAGYEVDSLTPVTAMGNARVPRLSRAFSVVARDLAYLAFTFRAHPRPTGHAAPT